MTGFEPGYQSSQSVRMSPRELLRFIYIQDWIIDLLATDSCVLIISLVYMKFHQEKCWQRQGMTVRTEKESWVWKIKYSLIINLQSMSMSFPVTNSLWSSAASARREQGGRRPEASLEERRRKRRRSLGVVLAWRLFIALFSNLKYN